MTESRGNSKEKNGRRVRATERKVMFMASLQVQQPLGQDSVISLTEMEHCQCQNGGFCLFFFSTTLKVLLEVNRQQAG